MFRGSSKIKNKNIYFFKELIHYLLSDGKGVLLPIAKTSFESLHKLDQGKLIAEFIDMITEEDKDEINSKISILDMFLEFLTNKEKSIDLDESKTLTLVDFLEKQGIDTNDPFYVNDKEFRFTEDNELEKINDNQHHHFMYGIHVKRMFDGYRVDYGSEN